VQYKISFEAFPTNRKLRTSVEVDQGLQGNLGGNVVLLLGLGHLLAEVVVRGHVGVVVHLVVQLHDLAGDGRLECAIVVCNARLANLFYQIDGMFDVVLTRQVRQRRLSANKRRSSQTGPDGSSGSRSSEGRAHSAGAEQSRRHGSIGFSRRN
jgi:hypothetical protein